MPTKITTVYKNHILDGFTGKTAFDVNFSLSGNTVVYFYSGVAPGDPTIAPAGALLETTSGGQFTWGTSAAGGVRQIGVSKSFTMDASGTVGFVRLGPNNTAAIDLTASLTGGGGEIILDTLNAVAGSPVTVTACSVRWPETNGGTIRFNTALRNKLVDMIVSAGTVAMMSSTISFYSGTQPASANEAVPAGSVLLGSRSLIPSHFNAASGGSVSATGGLGFSGVATGTVTWARLTQDALVMDVSAGTSLTDIILDTANVTNGSSVVINSFVLSL